MSTGLFYERQFAWKQHVLQKNYQRARQLRKEERLDHGRSVQPHPYKQSLMNKTRRSSVFEQASSKLHNAWESSGSNVTRYSTRKATSRMAAPAHTPPTASSLAKPTPHTNNTKPSKPGPSNSGSRSRSSVMASRRCAEFLQTDRTQSSRVSMSTPPKLLRPVDHGTDRVLGKAKDLCVDIRATVTPSSASNICNTQRGRKTMEEELEFPVPIFKKGGGIGEDGGKEQEPQPVEAKAMEDESALPPAPENTPRPKLEAEWVQIDQLEGEGSGMNQTLARAEEATEECFGRTRLGDDGSGHGDESLSAKNLFLLDDGGSHDADPSKSGRSSRIYGGGCRRLGSDGRGRFGIGAEAVVDGGGIEGCMSEGANTDKDGQSSSSPPETMGLGMLVEELLCKEQAWKRERAQLLTVIKLQQRKMMRHPVTVNTSTTVSSSSSAQTSTSSTPALHRGGVRGSSVSGGTSGTGRGGGGCVSKHHQRQQHHSWHKWPEHTDTTWTQAREDEMLPFSSSERSELLNKVEMQRQELALSRGVDQDAPAATVSRGRVGGRVRGGGGDEGRGHVYKGHVEESVGAGVSHRGVGHRPKLESRLKNLEGEVQGVLQRLVLLDETVRQQGHSQSSLSHESGTAMKDQPPQAEIGMFYA